MQWREDAACAEIPWEYVYWFFGEGDEVSGLPSLAVHEQHERARMICYLCPVQLDCLSYWLDTGEEFGIWGGLTVSQRKRYLTPMLRKKDWRGVEEVMIEVIWNLGMRLYPKIEAAYKRMGLPAPELPVSERVGRKVLVEIISSGEAQAA
jgi:hypothetical protein